jgi:hypothetical protein
MGRMWMEYPVRYLPIDQEEVGLAATVWGSGTDYEGLRSAARGRECGMYI